MFLSLFFWLALALPGYVIVRKLYKEDLECGLLGTLGLSYLAIFGLLSPISIACYVLELPVAVLSTACVLAIAAAPIIISQRGGWREVGKLILTGLTLEFLVIAINMAMGARVGAYVIGDAFAHVARIRFLLHHGMSNLDPYVTAECFYPTYHTNLLHALQAACSQLTQLDPTSVWFASLVWAKVVLASGVYYLAWTVFGRRWPAWIAAMFFIGERGMSPLGIYPNQLAPAWLFPFIVAFAVQACRGGCTWRACLKMGVASLVIGQIHGLYAVFAAIALLPTLFVAAIVRLRAGWRGAIWPAVCLPVVMIGLVFPAVSRSMTPAIQAALQAEATAEQRAEDKGQTPKTANVKQHDAYDYFDDGSVALRPGWGWAGSRLRAKGLPASTPRWIGKAVGKAIRYHRYALIVGGLCLAFFTRRRGYAIPLAGVVASIAFAIYFPPACTFLLARCRQPWILARMPFLIAILLYAIGLPAVVYCIAQRFRVRWWMRSAVNLAFVAFVVTSYCWQKEPFTWKAQFDKVLAAAEDRATEYRLMMGVRDFMKQHVPPGQTILAEAGFGMLVASTYDCRLVAAARASDGVPDQAQRLRELRVMLQDATPWPQRRDLLRKYGSEYFLTAGGDASWTNGHARQVWHTDRGMTLVRLQVE